MQGQPPPQPMSMAPGGGQDMGGIHQQGAAGPTTDSTSATPPMHQGQKIGENFYFIKIENYLRFRSDQRMKI